MIAPLHLNKQHLRASKGSVGHSSLCFGGDRVESCKRWCKGDGRRLCSGGGGGTNHVAPADASQLVDPDSPLTSRHSHERGVRIHHNGAAGERSGAMGRDDPHGRYGLTVGAVVATSTLATRAWKRNQTVWTRCRTTPPPRPNPRRRVVSETARSNP